MKKSWTLRIALIGFILVIPTVLMGGYWYYKNKIQSLPSLSIPYPFQVVSKDMAAVPNPHVLVLGDQMGLSLKNYFAPLSEELSKDLENTINFEVQGHPRENLARSLSKLKSMEKLPPIIVYLGSGHELFEKLFMLKDFENIQNNFKRFENVKIASLLYTFPFMAKFIYKPFTMLTLSEAPQKDDYNYTDKEFMKKAQLHYKFFEYQLRELIRIVSSKGKKLVLMTTPINLELKPQKICHSNLFPELENALSSINLLYLKKDYKSALNELEKIESLAKSHARYHYIKGTSLKKIGQYKEALKSLKLANAFDCNPRSANIIFNTIIRKLSDKYAVTLIDFAKILNDDFGRNILFEDDFFPQHFYYQKAIGHLEQIIKSELKL